jgi:hypothetical protein
MITPELEIWKVSLTTHIARNVSRLVGTQRRLNQSLGQHQIISYQTLNISQYSLYVDFTKTIRLLR